MWVFSYPDLLSTEYEITICVVFILVAKKGKKISNWSSQKEVRHTRGYHMRDLFASQ